MKRFNIDFSIYIALSIVLIVLSIPMTRDFFAEYRLRWLYILLFSFIISFISTPIIKFIAKKLNVYDHPNERKVHKESTPLLGGVAVYIAFASAIIFNDVFSDELKGIAIGATIIFVLGIIDDIVGLRALIKLLTQSIAIFVMIAYGVVADFLPDTWWGHMCEILITYIGVLGITNALNFFDGMDGLATGLTGVTALFLGFLAIQTNQYYLMFLSIALLGSCMGFFPYNFRLKQPAQIFLGDCGSTFMGFMLAGLTVMGGWGAEDPIKAYTMPILILGVLIFDMIYLTVSRFATRKVHNFTEWLDFTGKDHLHHRIAALGFGNRSTVLFIFLIDAALGLGAIVLKDGRTIDAIFLLIQTTLIYMVIVVLMLKGKQQNSD